MHSLKEEEIDYILSDLESQGITDPDLRDSLLDHICIIVENEMSEDEDFRSFYGEILPRFFTDDLQEIQTETTNLMRFKHFYAMKKTLKIAGLLTALFTALGAIFKTFHLPGAGVLIVLGGFFLSFVFLPLLIVLKSRDEDSRTDKAVFSFGFIIGIILSAGLIFKLMHWPMANILMISSTIVFTFVYVPLYFFTRFNRPEIRFNTIVNTVLMFACGGIFFSLFDLSYSNSYKKHITENHRFIHENSNRLFDSNNRLIDAPNQSERALELHNISLQLNEDLEEIASVIVNKKSTKHVEAKLTKLQSTVHDYNTLLEDLAFEELQSLDPSGLEILNRLDMRTGLNALARIQQQLAVNENCFLTSSVVASLE